MICCKSNGMVICFDEEKAQIDKLLYREKNYVYAPISVFEIAQRDIKGNQIKTTANDFILNKCDYNSNKLVCLYTNGELSIEVSAYIQDSVEWHIKVQNFGKNVIEWVNFPQIIVKNDLKNSGGDSKILWGFNEGALIDNMEFRNSSWGYIEPEYPSEGVMGLFPAIVETQFMAYYDNHSGLYFASHDADENLKGIDFYEYDGGIKLQFRHYTGCDFGQDYTMPYPMVMQFFEGDWMDAAAIYRDWFEKNCSDEYLPIKENSNLPEWYSNSPIIVTYPVRGLFDTDEMYPNKLFPYTNAIKHIEELESKFDSRIMVILMHWEGTAPWAPPIVWPPYGGEDELKKFIDILHSRNDVLGVYCSGLGWTQKSNLTDYEMTEMFEESNLKEYMCLSPEQELPFSKICTDQRYGYDMCPTQEFTVNVICDQVKKMFDAGIDYIQLMDQNHGGTSYFCYSRKHNHPPVPGKWQVDAVKNLLDKAEKDTGKVLFGCESAAAEAYIPQLLFSDNRYNLCYTVGEPVPMYSFIYHKYLNNFMGNQVCTHAAFDHKKSPENILIRTAYAFCCGDMLTVVLNDDGKFIFNWGYRDMDDLPDQEALSMLIKNLNYWRQGEHRKYLHYGIMEKPYEVMSSKVIIYGARGFNHEYDRVFTSAWKTEEGEFGQFLVNHTKDTVTCNVNLPENIKFALYGNDGKKIREISGNSKIEIKKLSGVLIERV